MKKGKRDVAVSEQAAIKSQAGFAEKILQHPYLIIAILPVVCFGRTIFFEFLNYDDQLFIVDNQKLIHDFSNVSKVFSQGIWSFIHFVSSYDYYRPFLMLSLMIDAQIGGTSPVMYHLSNLLYHIIASLLLFRLLIKLNIENKKSLVLALLFAVHPIVTQAVAWIPGRNDTLLAIFILASFLNFISYIRSGKKMFLILHFLFFFFALLTKESAILLPVICIYYTSFIAQKKIFSGNTIVFTCFWVLIACAYFYTRAKALGKMENEVTLPLLAQTVIYRLPAIVQYMGKMILPFNLSVKPTQQDTGILPGIIAVLIIAASLFFSKQKDYRQIFFGVLWFLLFLIPVLSLPKLFNDNLFEHRAYLPLMGILVLLNESFLFKNKFFRGRNGMLISVAAISLFFVISFNHTRNFKTALVFWQNAASNSPRDSEAHIKLSNQYFIKGDEVNTEIHIQKALALKPGIERANAGLGAICARKGEFEKAEIYYKKEIAIGTRYIEDFKGLGSVLMTLKKENDAIISFEKALQLDSTDKESNLNLGFLYFNKQDYGAAEKIWKRVLILYPDQLRVRESLAILYSRTGNYKEALLLAAEEEKLGGKMPDGFTRVMQEQLKMQEKNFNK